MSFIQSSHLVFDSPARREFGAGLIEIQQVNKSAFEKTKDRNEPLHPQSEYTQDSEKELGVPHQAA